jgi:type III restriction enzyme
MNGVNVILEVKGLVDEKEKAKFEAAKRWCRAVNSWGKMGTWAFHVAKDPDHVQKELKFLNQKA